MEQVDLSGNSEVINLEHFFLEGFSQSFLSPAPPFSPSNGFRPIPPSTIKMCIVQSLNNKRSDWKMDPKFHRLERLDTPQSSRLLLRTNALNYYFRVEEIGNNQSVETVEILFFKAKKGKLGDLIPVERNRQEYDASKPTDFYHLQINNTESTEGVLCVRCLDSLGMQIMHEKPFIYPFYIRLKGNNGDFIQRGKPAFDYLPQVQYELEKMNNPFDYPIQVKQELQEAAFSKEEEEDGEGDEEEEDLEDKTHKLVCFLLKNQHPFEFNGQSINIKIRNRENSGSESNKKSRI